MAFLSEVASVTTTAAAITSTVPGKRSQKCTLYASPSNTGTIYIGRSDVTTSNGIPLLANQTLEVDAEDLPVIYAVASTGTQSLHLAYDSQITPIVRQNAASVVAIADAGGFTDATDVEDALAEVYQDLKSAQAFIEIPLTAFRLIATNEIAASGAADGGVLSSDTAPTYARVNGATDKALSIQWAAAGVEEITAPFVYPPDLDDAADIVVNMRCKMAGATDTPVIAVGFFEGIGDSNAGGNTAALSNSLATKSVTIAAANVGAYPNFASISLTPGSHDNDILELYSVWIEYTRKLRTA